MISITELEALTNHFCKPLEFPYFSCGYIGCWYIVNLVSFYAKLNLFKKNEDFACFYYL